MNAAVAKAIALAGGPAKVAARLGCSVQAACYYRDGDRKLPERLGAALERLCGEQVRRWHMWPDDWHLIWPELVGSPGAPPEPARAPAAAASGG